jgi:hypothetical protein
MFTCAAALGRRMSARVRFPRRPASNARPRPEHAIHAAADSSHANGQQGLAESCGACGAPLASDQRYCLHCGERRATVSSFLLAGRPRAAAPASPHASPGAPPAEARTEGHGSLLTAIAGVGVLLLAMGIGVLIGRTGGSKASIAQPPVVTVASTPSGGAQASGGEAAFGDDWPAGKSGYTVQLQKLPQAGTTVSAVQAAKAAASAKGAKDVGALRSEDFSSLPVGSYIVYSGVYRKRSEAEQALASLRKRFPGASVIRVSNGTGEQAGGGDAAGGSGVGASEQHPAPPTVVQSLKNVKGKSYEERSKNLPDVISTG